MEPVAVYSDLALKGTKLYNDFHSDLATISKRDYDDNAYGFPNGIEAIDVDAVETAQRGGQNDSTMDSAIGIADYTNTIKNPRLLLVELRMNYTGQAKNCKTSDMINKDSHTRDLLSSYVIDRKSFFVFTKNVAPHKKSVIDSESKTNSKIRHFQIVSPDQFVLLYKFVKDLPYQPISNIETIKKQALDFLQKNAIESLLKLIEHWLNKEDEYYRKYNLNECSAILSAIESILASTKTYTCSFSEDNQIYFEMYEELFDKAVKRLKAKN